MTVNPNPLSRAQWLFSTSFSFLLDKSRQAQPWFPCSAVAHACLFCTSMAMEPQYGNQLNPGETCPCPRPQHWAGIPGCRFALGQKPSCSPRSIITPNGRDLLGEKRYVVFLNFGMHYNLCRSNVGIATSLFISSVGMSSDESQHEQVFV